MQKNLQRNPAKSILNSKIHRLTPFANQQASAWCCPVNGRKQEILAEEGAYKAAAPDCNCYPCVESTNILPEDLELWVFCPSIFANRLSPGLGLHADLKLMKEGVLHLGTLACRSTRLPAFLLNCNDTSYQLRAQAIVAEQAGICIFYTPRYCPEIAEWLGQLQHGYFPLEELLFPDSLDPSPTYWQRSYRSLKQPFRIFLYAPAFRFLLLPILSG